MDNEKKETNGLDNTVGTTKILTEQNYWRRTKRMQQKFER